MSEVLSEDRGRDGERDSSRRVEVVQFERARNLLR